VLDIHHGVLISHKKNEVLSCAGKWMELEIIMLSGISQSHKDKYGVFSPSPICGSGKSKTKQKAKVMRVKGG
jgi:hypothetical protein